MFTISVNWQALLQSKFQKNMLYHKSNFLRYLLFNKITFFFTFRSSSEWGAFAINKSQSQYKPACSSVPIEERIAVLWTRRKKPREYENISNFTLRFDLIGKINAHADLKVIDYVTITIENGEYFSMLLSLALVWWADNDKRITLIVKKKQGKANFE